MRENRSGCLVLFCSLIVPGLGQIIQGRAFAGFSFFIAAFFLWLLFWVYFLEVLYYFLEHPGAKIPESDFLGSALGIGHNLAICVVHLWSLADCAKATKE